MSISNPNTLYLSISERQRLFSPGKHFRWIEKWEYIDRKIANSSGGFDREEVDNGSWQPVPATEPQNVLKCLEWLLKHEYAVELQVADDYSEFALQWDRGEQRVEQINFPDVILSAYLKARSL